MNKTFIDGSLKEQIKSLKEFCGLSSEQSFDEIDIDDINDEGIQAR